MSTVHKRLAAFFDTFPQRFPKDSETGQRVLKLMFSEEEAQMVMNLQPMPETTAAIAQRLGKDEKELGEQLYAMSRKGLIFRMGDPGGYLYMATSFATGVIEFYINSYTKELAKALALFREELYRGTWMKGTTREIRTVPIGESVAAGFKVLPYESAKELILSAGKISVAECMCAKMNGLEDKAPPASSA